MNHAAVRVGGLLYSVQNGSRPWSLAVTGDPSCRYRFEVRTGDHWLGETQTATVERSELAAPIDDSNPARLNAETWTAYQFRIEPGPPSSAGWVVLGDWHVRPDPGDTLKMSSPWQLELRKGDILVFDIRVSGEKPVRDNAPERHIYTSTAPITRGTWHSLVSVADFDARAQGTGGVTVWLDGEQIADYHGPFGYILTNPPYFKFGIYRSVAPETLAVDYANVEISRAALSSRIHNPPPVCTTGM
jgi:hypothetical protein